MTGSRWVSNVMPLGSEITSSPATRLSLPNLTIAFRYTHDTSPTSRTILDGAPKWPHTYCGSAPALEKPRPEPDERTVIKPLQPAAGLCAIPPQPATAATNTPTGIRRLMSLAQDPTWCGRRRDRRPAPCSVKSQLTFLGNTALHERQTVDGLRGPPSASVLSSHKPPARFCLTAPSCALEPSVVWSPGPWFAWRDDGRGPARTRGREAWRSSEVRAHQPRTGSMQLRRSL